MIKRIVKIFLFIFTNILESTREFRSTMMSNKSCSTAPWLEKSLLRRTPRPMKSLILAMIYTETKGREDDVMQASESASGETNTISDNKASIRQGIQTLSDELK